MNDQTPQTMTRRYALRVIGGTALALPIALKAQDASARRVWCRADPVCELSTPDGRKGADFSIYVSAALEDYELNNSSGDIQIEHPKDAKTNKIWEDPNGYLGQGISTNFKINERMKFRTNDMDIGIRLYIPASRNDMQIMLEYAPGPITFTNGAPNPAPVWASAIGRGNSWITLRSTLPYTAKPR